MEISELPDTFAEPLPWARPQAPPDQLRRWSRYVRHSHTAWVLDALDEIESQRLLLLATSPTGERPTLSWLVPFRPVFRAIRDCETYCALHLYLQRCAEEMVPLALWLLSRKANRFGLFGLPAYIDASDPHVQRILARTFLRCETWVLLDRMWARQGPSDEIGRFLALARRRAPFTQRMANWNRHVSQQPAAVAAPPPPLWFRDWPWSLAPPKSAAAIRRALRRIHWLVRWRV